MPYPLSRLIEQPAKPNSRVHGNRSGKLVYASLTHQFHLGGALRAEAAEVRALDDGRLDRTVFDSLTLGAHFSRLPVSSGRSQKA